MNSELDSGNYATAFRYIDNETNLMKELEKFKQLAWQARERGILTASKFEYKLLTKALDEGPEKLAQVIQHLTPDDDRRHMHKLARQANKFLPFINPEQVLSDWAIKQINRYFVRGRLKGECEFKLLGMAEAMTDSFVINALIEASRTEDRWEKIVAHILHNYQQMSDLKNISGK